MKLNTALAASRAGALAADAVRFSPVIYRLYLPLTLRQWPPVPATPVLNAIVNPDYAPNYAVAWSSVENASSYTLQEGSNPSFGDAVTRYNGPDTTWAATDHAPGEFYYRIKAANAWGDSPWSAPQHVKIVLPDPCKQNFLVNGDFEAGLPGTPWEQYSNGGYDVISTERPRGDSAWGVYMGGFVNAEEWVKQPFVVPADADSATFVFWWVLTTTTKLSGDYLEFGIQDETGAYLREPERLYSNLIYNHWMPAGMAISGLTQWAGRTLRVTIAGYTNDGTATTEFFVDDAAMVVGCDNAFSAVISDTFPVIHLPQPTPAP